jgi:F-type H+-transporting ATPase subunit delta
MQGASRESLATVREQLTALRGDAALATVSEDLFGVVRLLDREGNLRRTLGDASLPGQAKSSLVEGLLGSQVDATSLSLITAAAGLRWGSARDIVDAIEVLAVTATFLVADEAGELDDVEDELFRFARVVAREPELRAVLTDHALDPERKSALLDGLLDGKVKAATKRIAQALVVTPRGRTLEKGLEEYADLAADIRSRTLATVTSAVPLDDAQKGRLAATLSAQLGREVQVQVEVDPKVVGGVLVRIGDEVIDGSTRHRLAEAKRSLS